MYYLYIHHIWKKPLNCKARTNDITDDSKPCFKPKIKYRTAIHHPLLPIMHPAWIAPYLPSGCAKPAREGDGGGWRRTACDQLTSQEIGKSFVSGDR